MALEIQDIPEGIGDQIQGVFKSLRAAEITAEEAEALIMQVFTGIATRMTNNVKVNAGVLTRAAFLHLNGNITGGHYKYLLTGIGK